MGLTKTRASPLANNISYFTEGENEKSKQRKEKREMRRASLRAEKAKLLREQKQIDEETNSVLLKIYRQIISEPEKYVLGFALFILGFVIDRHFQKKTRKGERIA